MSGQNANNVAVVVDGTTHWIPATLAKTLSGLDGADEGTSRIVLTTEREANRDLLRSLGVISGAELQENGWISPAAVTPFGSAFIGVCIQQHPWTEAEKKAAAAELDRHRQEYIATGGIAVEDSAMRRVRRRLVQKLNSLRGLS